MAGYSTTPLAKKLGIKEYSRVKVVGAPAHYVALLDPLPPGVIISSRLRGNITIWHLFIQTGRGLAGLLEKAMDGIQGNGSIWVSWPKKASGVATDITEDEIRKAALPLGLVDIKVCAIDETWSGLKLVIRKQNRN